MWKYFYRYESNTWRVAPQSFLSVIGRVWKQLPPSRESTPVPQRAPMGRRPSATLTDNRQFTVLSQSWHTCRLEYSPVMAPFAIIARTCPQPGSKRGPWVDSLLRSPAYVYGTYRSYAKVLQQFAIKKPTTTDTGFFLACSSSSRCRTWSRSGEDAWKSRINSRRFGASWRGVRRVARCAQLDSLPAEGFHFWFHSPPVSFLLLPRGSMQEDKSTFTIRHHCDTSMSERLQNNDTPFLAMMWALPHAFTQW